MEKEELLKFKINLLFWVENYRCAGAKFTFFGGGGGFLRGPVFGSSATLFWSFKLFLESTSDKTTKKWWHFSHFTNLVEAVEQK
jgi:hypothetical protein